MQWQSDNHLLGSFRTAILYNLQAQLRSIEIGGDNKGLGIVANGKGNARSNQTIIDTNGSCSQQVT